MIDLQEAERLLARLREDSSNADYASGASHMLTVLANAGAFTRPSEIIVQSALVNEGIPSSAVNYTLRVLRKVGLLATLALLGCRGGQLSVYADPALVPETTRAIDEWNRALAKGPCSEYGLYYSGDADASVSVLDQYAYGYAAYTYERTIRVDLELNRYPGMLTTTIAHELGHALGSDHSAYVDDLMFGAVPLWRDATPTGYDVARVCAYYWEGI